MKYPDPRDDDQREGAAPAAFVVVCFGGIMLALMVGACIAFWRAI